MRSALALPALAVCDPELSGVLAAARRAAGGREGVLLSVNGLPYLRSGDGGRGGRPASVSAVVLIAQCPLDSCRRDMREQWWSLRRARPRRCDWHSFTWYGRPLPCCASVRRWLSSFSRTRCQRLELFRRYAQLRSRTQVSIHSIHSISRPPGAAHCILHRHAESRNDVDADVQSVRRNARKARVAKGVECNKCHQQYAHTVGSPRAGRSGNSALFCMLRAHSHPTESAGKWRSALQSIP